MRASSSVTLPPRLSTSSANAGAARPENRNAARIVRFIGLLLRLGDRVLVGEHRLAEVDRGAVLRIGRDGVALLEADDLELDLLALGRGEGVAGPGGELVPLQVREQAVAVALVDHLHRQRV